jgi:glycosyltransferase involved in cell wall biosynthesis
MQRFFDAKRSNSPYKGITKYAKIMLNELITCQQVKLVPVVPYNSKLFKVHQKLFDYLLSDKRYYNDTKRINLLKIKLFSIALLGKLNDFLGYMKVNFKSIKKLVNARKKSLVHKLTQENARHFHYSAFGLEMLLIKDEDRGVYFSPCHPLPAENITKKLQRVITIHDCIYLIKPDFYPIPDQVPQIQFTIDSINPQKDFVICDSESTLNDVVSLTAISRNQVKVIHLAAEKAFYQNFEAEREKLKYYNLKPNEYLIVLGQEEKRKNIKISILAFSQLVQSFGYTNIKLLIVGADNNFKCDLLVFISENCNGIEPSNIVFTKNVDESTLGYFFFHSLAFVYPSLYEGFGIPVLEAMAAGCPVILGNNSSLCEVAGNAGLYVNVEDVSDIADGLRNIIANPSLKEALVKRGQQQAALFSWEITANKTIQFLKKICSNVQQGSQVG